MSGADTKPNIFESSKMHFQKLSPIIHWALSAVCAGILSFLLGYLTFSIVESTFNTKGPTDSFKSPEVLPLPSLDETGKEGASQFSDCIEKIFNLDHCENQVRVAHKTLPTPVNTKSDSDGAIDSILIDFLYYILISVFLTQTTLAIHSFLSPAMYHKSTIYLVDFNVNSAPMIGVIGTVIAFAYFSSNSTSLDLLANFNEVFPLAAKTTIYGGLIYIWNLFLTVPISKKIE